MKSKPNRNILNVLIIFIITLSNVVMIIAQEPAKATKKTKIEEEIEKKSVSMLYTLIGDAEKLTLPENQITVLLSIADMLWKHDENKARESMVEAVKIFNTMPNQDKDEDEDEVNATVDGIPEADWRISEIRREIIQKAAKHDPNFAITFLTSSKAIIEKTPGHYSNEQDLQFTIAPLVAQSDPKKALQLAKDYITSTGNIDNMEGTIQALNKKDPESARNLIDAIITKFRSDNTISIENLSPLNNLLRHAPPPNSKSNKTDEPQFLLNKKQAKELTEVIIKIIQNEQSKNKTDDSSDPSYMNSMLSQIMPTLSQYVETYSPESMGVFKKITNETDENIDPYEKEWNKLQEVTNNSTAEKLIELGKSADPDIQNDYYQQAINKLLTEGNIHQARKIANEQIVAPLQRKTALQHIENHLLNKYMREQRYDDARSTIRNMPSKIAKVNAYIELAQNAQTGNNKALAEEILNEAFSLVLGPPKSNLQLNKQLAIADAFAGINPNRSFEIVELSINKCNEMMDASVSIAEFNNNRTMRRGELIGAQDSESSYFAQYLQVLPSLFHSDSARTESILNSINRNDARIMLKLTLLQNLLGVEGNTSNKYESGTPLSSHSIQIFRAPSKHDN